MSSPHPQSSPGLVDEQSNDLFDCLASTQGIPHFQYLLQSGSNPNIVDLTGISLLTRAVLTEQFNFVQLLLEYEADPLFVYDPEVYDQFSRYSPEEQQHQQENENIASSSHSLQTPPNSPPGVSSPLSDKTKGTSKCTKALSVSVAPQPYQIPMHELEPLPFISVHFKTRKIFDALIKALTFDEVLLLRNSSGQSIFEYAAFNCAEHMVMDSLLRYLKTRIDKFTPTNIRFVKPNIPLQYWPSSITSSSPTPSPSPQQQQGRGGEDRPIYPALIRFLAGVFISHAILNGTTTFVNLYLLYNADPNGCINDYSNGVMFLPTAQSMQELQAIQTLIVQGKEFEPAQFPHVRFLRWLLGRHHVIYNKLGSNLNPLLELEGDPVLVSNRFLMGFKFEPFIIVAAVNGYDDILLALIDEWADVNVTSNIPSPEHGGEHLNVLSSAFFNGHIKLCRKLLFPPKKDEKRPNNTQNGPNGPNSSKSPSNDPNNQSHPHDDEVQSTINTAQLDSLLTNQIKRYIDPINLSRVDQFITFRFQQYIQEQRELHHLRTAQSHQPSRLKGFFKGIVDATKGALHDLTDHPHQQNGQNNSQNGQNGQNGQNNGQNGQNGTNLLGPGMVSPVADLIAYNNATQLVATGDHQAQSSIINTVLPLPHHMRSLSQLLLAKPTKETLKNTSRNVEFCRRVYLEPLFIYFCDVNNHVMIEALLKLSLYRRHFILQMQKQSKIEQNEASLQKCLAERCIVPLQQHTVEDEINVADDNDDEVLPEQEEYDQDFNGLNDSNGAINGQNGPNGTNSDQALTKDNSSTALNTTTQRRSSTLPSDSGSASLHSASSLTAADFQLANPQLINSRNPHNEFRAMHYSILRLDLQLVQLLLRYRPQLLRTAQTNQVASPSMFPLDFAYFIQTQLREDLQNEIQHQYLQKLVELGLENPQVLAVTRANSRPGGVVSPRSGGVMGINNIGMNSMNIGMNNINSMNIGMNNMNIGMNNTTLTSTQPTINQQVHPTALNRSSPGQGVVNQQPGLTSPMNRNTPAFQRANAFASPSPGGINTNPTDPNVNMSILKPGLVLVIDWDIVDGELDMGEDDFTPLDDDSNDGNSTQSSQQPAQSFRQAFAAAKSSSNNTGPTFPTGKFAKNNSQSNSQNLQNNGSNLQNSQNSQNSSNTSPNGLENGSNRLNRPPMVTTSSLSSSSSSPKPSLDGGQSFDMIHDIGDIKTALGNGYPNNSNVIIKTNSVIAEGFTLVEPILEMESSPPVSPRGDSGHNPLRPSRPGRPVGGNSTTSSTNNTTKNNNYNNLPNNQNNSSQNNINNINNNNVTVNPNSSNTNPGRPMRPVPSPRNSITPPATSPTTTPRGIPRPTSHPSAMILDDSDDDDDFLSPMPEVINGVQSHGGNKGIIGSNSPNFVKNGTKNSPFNIEIGVLLSYVYKKERERRQQRVMADRLHRECDINQHVAFFGLSTPANPTITTHNDHIDDSHHPTSLQNTSLGDGAYNNNQNNEPQYARLIKLLSARFVISAPQRQQIAFLSTFLQPTPELQDILNKIAQLASIIDLLSYFVSVLIVPLQDSKANENNIDKLLVPLESSISRFGGLGFNPANSNTKRLLQLTQPKESQPKILPSLVDYYRHKQNIAKMRLLEEKGRKLNKKNSFGSSSGENGENDSDDSDDDLISSTRQSGASLTSFLLDEDGNNRSVESSSSSSSDDDSDDEIKKKFSNQNDQNEHGSNQNALIQNPNEFSATTLPPQPQLLVRRNSHFEKVAQSIDQLKKDSNGDEGSNNEGVQEKMLDLIDGSSHPNPDKTALSRPNNDETRPTTRDRCHRSRRVDISLAELSGQSPSSGSTTLKKKSQKTIFDDEDGNPKYEFSFAEKHRLMLIQLTNEHLNKDDDEFGKILKSKANEFKTWLQQRRDSGKDPLIDGKLTKFQQILYDYIEHDRYPDQYEDFIDIDIKTAPVSGLFFSNSNPEVNNNANRLLRPSALQLNSSVNSNSSGAGSPKNKKRIRWVDQA